jgi:hypothetical protein
MARRARKDATEWLDMSRIALGQATPYVSWHWRVLLGGEYTQEHHDGQIRTAARCRPSTPAGAQHSLRRPARTHRRRPTRPTWSARCTPAWRS